jgi:nitrate reductase NapAB chaperone NapD
MVAIVRGGEAIMAQIGNIPEINEIKLIFSKLKEDGMIEEWELPHENILTRLASAIFFVSPANKKKIDHVSKRLQKYPHYEVSTNDSSLSVLSHRIRFGL